MVVTLSSEGAGRAEAEERRAATAAMVEIVNCILIIVNSGKIRMYGIKIDRRIKVGFEVSDEKETEYKGREVCSWK